MTKTQDTDLNRKYPAQARARQTFETLLDATAQILTEEGSKRLTTNYLAERAGFSIGTVYQYFPNREAIVLALIERQREQVGRLIEATLDDRPDDGTEEKIRRIVHLLHQAFNVHRMPERRLTQALLHLAAEHGLPDPPHTAAQAIIKIWGASNGASNTPLNESELFVLTHSLVGVLREATLYASPLLGSVEFEQAIVRLVLGFLRGTA